MRSVALLLVAGMGAGTLCCGTSEIGGTRTREREKGGIFCSPCFLPVAIEVTVTSQGGGPIAGAAVRVLNDANRSFLCVSAGTGSVCNVSGEAGTYHLEVTATGFQSTRRVVAVSGTMTPGPCPCPEVTTERVDVVLKPSE